MHVLAIAVAFYTEDHKKAKITYTSKEHLSGLALIHSHHCLYYPRAHANRVMSWCPYIYIYMCVQKNVCKKNVI